jgi:F0F1-type ATP synthase assembly protein I
MRMPVLSNHERREKKKRDLDREQEDFHCFSAGLVTGIFVGLLIAWLIFVFA